MQQPPAQWSDPAYEAVVQLLHERTGLAFGPTVRFAAEAGTRRAMERAGIIEVGAYLESLGNGSADFSALVEEMTVCETFFFRQPAHFELVRARVLPEIQKRRGEDHVLRVWSAGCASGEEPYSLAILLKEAGFGEKSYILGTDINRVALEKARAAEYGLWSLRGVEDGLIRRNFNREGYKELLDPELRKQVVLVEMNLAAEKVDAKFLRGFDVIFCRNVMIYFDAQTVQRVAQRLYDSLSDGGWLITGASDPLLSGYAPFETVVTRHGAVYRKPVRPKSAPIELLRERLSALRTMHGTARSTVACEN